jgi:HK97 family phage portal protein
VWVVTERDGFGHPTRVQPIDRDWWHIGDDVWLVPSPPVVFEYVGGVWCNPRTATRDDLIIFDTGGPGALDRGWLALRTALALESAANNYATAPLPAMALKSAGVDLDETESQELLNAWETARRQRSTAYLNSQVDLETFGWNAAELQLVEARQQAAVEIARVLNLDPYFVGATVGGSSLTYQNRTDLYQSLLDFTLMPLLRVIEQTLSREPNSSASRVLRFDTTAFLRANLTDRVNALTAYVTAGIITPQQAADMEPMIRKGDVPQ